MNITHLYPELTVLYSPRYWTFDAVMDFVLPSFAVALVALLLTAIN